MTVDQHVWRTASCTEQINSDRELFNASIKERPVKIEVSQQLSVQIWCIFVWTSLFLITPWTNNKVIHLGGREPFPLWLLQLLWSAASCCPWGQHFSTVSSSFKFSSTWQTIATRIYSPSLFCVNSKQAGATLKKNTPVISYIRARVLNRDFQNFTVTAPFEKKRQTKTIWVNNCFKNITSRRPSMLKVPFS